MFFALCKFEIFLPQSGSLKSKRSVINSLKERLRSRFGTSAGEVGALDLRQRGIIGVALVGQNPSSLEAALSAMRRLVDQETRCTVISWEVRVEPFEGAARAPRNRSLALDDLTCAGGDSVYENDWDSDEEDDEHFGGAGKR